MSQKAPRKSAVNEDKEKRQTDSPAKEMKKKMAANAEKEKQAAEKSEKCEKPAEKTTETKVDKAEKKTEKGAEKKEPHTEKQKEESSKGEKSGKNEKPDKEKQKQNGNTKPHNGVSDVTLCTNGGTDELNGTVSADSDDDDVMLVIDDEHDQDELFPELTYDDTSDVECFDSPTPDNVPSRSFTRRSQVKVTRTPETPRPASDKQPEKDTNDPKDKVLKLKEEAPPSSDRKLRSSDSPKRQEVKKTLEQIKKDKLHDSPKKGHDEKIEDGKEKAVDDNKKTEESTKVSEVSEEPGQGTVVEPTVTILQVIEETSEDSDKRADNPEKIEMEVVVEVEAEGAGFSDRPPAAVGASPPAAGSIRRRRSHAEHVDEPRKTDTNYSKSRVKVSPYRRSGRLNVADQTTTSLLANYTGNNTTMEMDITESSFISDEGASLDDSSYLRGLRTIRGRSSYKPLKEINLKHVANRSQRSVNTSVDSQRPTGTVVGRKRKPDADRDDVIESSAAADTACAHTKRMRILDRIAMPFRRTIPSHLPRRPAEIVGINTDLPLVAPVAAPPAFDPESLKQTPSAPAPAAVPRPEPVAVPLTHEERDSKRCVVM